MQFLKKENKILYDWIFPIILLPIISIIGEIILKLTFNLGNYYGTFLRGIYELVLRNF